MDINRFEITNGKLAFVEVNADPTIDLQINQLTFTADNLRNIVAKDRTLPSPIKATRKSIGGGDFSIDGKVNLIKEIPDMDLAFALENVDVTAINDFSNHYASLDFERGDLGLFSEIAIADGYLKGYFKTLLSDSKFIGKEDGFLETLWEGLVGFFRYILKNQRTDTLAVKAPLEGDLTKVETGVWSAIGSIFRNAFIDAFEKGVDGEVEYEDAFAEENSGQTDSKNKPEKEEKR
ncbi:MAG: DUF748 domain-containing protein [Saprospiraceae bacterium]